jgi:hypothetical protein
VATPPPQIGLGLQATGSACCISIRVWTTDIRGLELVLNAEQLLFLTLRGLSKFTDNPTVNGYTGAGLTLVLGIPQPVTVPPIEALQFLVGVEATPIVPPLPQLGLDVEAALEFQLNRGFFTSLGAGFHLYF